MKFLKFLRTYFLQNISSGYFRQFQVSSLKLYVKETSVKMFSEKFAKVLRASFDKTPLFNREY